MKKITVISGKGGTGKTTLTASLSALFNNHISVDCDVDAANLYLILNPKVLAEHEFKASKVATIDKSRCQACGACLSHCRFEAISCDYIISPISCEGCGVCFKVCPFGAIDFSDKVSGHYFISETRLGPLVHARLGIAEDNSGRLVTLIRNRAEEIAQKKKLDYILIDGPPGIGCPVIASLTGVDLVVIVTEPTLSGIHDLKRVVGLCQHFKIEAFVVVNKYDLNLNNLASIEEYCRKEGVKIVGKIAYDLEINQALVRKETVIEYNPESQISKEITKIAKVLQA